MSPRISVLVVDDSVVVRRLVTNVLDSDPDLEVVGTAASGRIALAKLAELKPDAITLDVEMPDLDGLATLRELRKTHPRLPVIMFSTLTERGAVATLDALAAGANDYVCKPTRVSSVPQAMESVRTQLIPKIKALCARTRPPLGTGKRPAAPVAARPLPPQPTLRTRGRSRVDVVTIGASTGGPDALSRLLPELPADLAVPVVVVQHMPALFTRLFAQRLNGKCALTVREAVDGEELVPGVVLVAPGDRHLVLERSGGVVRTALSDAAPENFCRPSVDVLFRSAAEVYGEHVLSLVLTGMGSDGARGAEAVRAAGGEVVAQDQATSVVWGMPGAVSAAGTASRVLPLEALSADVVDALQRGRRLPRIPAGVRS